jgi:hypothetical protein
MMNPICFLCAIHIIVSVQGITIPLDAAIAAKHELQYYLTDFANAVAVSGLGWLCGPLSNINQVHHALSDHTIPSELIYVNKSSDMGCLLVATYNDEDKNDKHQSRHGAKTDVRETRRHLVIPLTR